MEATNASERHYGRTGGKEMPGSNGTVRLVIAFAAALSGALAAPAHAGEKEKAEHIQLSEEMKQYASRNAWAGVEAHYQRLLELEKKGEKLTYAEHHLGAEAAKTEGNMSQYKLRLERAAAAPAATDAEKAQVQTDLAEIEANYGTVKITFADKKGSALAEPEVFPFAPDQRASILYINNNFLGNGTPYEGLMPQGTYTIESTTFTVTPGAKTEVKISSKEKEPKEPDYDLTAGFRVSTAASWMQGATSENSPVSGPFGGFGVRTGVGGELALAPHAGILVEAGYQGFTSPSEDTAPDHLRAGYAWLAGTARTNGGLKLALGPSAALGSAQVTPENNGPSPELLYPSFTTQIGLIGGAAGVECPLVDVGTSQLVLEGRAIMMADAERVWPSVTLGVSLSPAFKQE